MFTVLVTEKGGTKQKLEFDEEIISVGRVQGNDIILPRGNVSKRHCKIEFKNGNFFLLDAGSTNGTYINGRKALESTQLFKEDKIYIGDYIIALEDHDGLKRREELSAAEKLPKPRTPRPGPPSKPKKHTTEEMPEMTKPQLDIPRPTAVSPPTPDVSRPKVSPPRPAKKAAAPLKSNDAELYTLVETLLDQVARKVKRVNRTEAPSRMDPGSAGQVRIVLDELVADFERRGKITGTIDSNVLRGKVFRAAVDLGPLSVWLDDPEVKMIRVFGPDEVMLLKDGEWTEAITAFVSKEDLADYVGCMSAGLQIFDDGLSRYRLEEGFMVQSANGGASLTIDKTSSSLVFNNVASAIIEKALEDGARIAITGTNAGRNSVTSTLIGMLPTNDFVVTIENVWLSVPFKRNMIRLSRSDGSGLIQRSSDLHPDWIVISGSTWGEVPQLFCASTAVSKSIIELPFTSIKNMENELTAAYTISGCALLGEDAKNLAKNAFDMIIEARRDSEGAVVIGKIVSSEGKELFTRK